MQILVEIYFTNMISQVYTVIRRHSKGEYKEKPQKLKQDLEFLKNQFESVIKALIDYKKEEIKIILESSITDYASFEEHQISRNATDFTYTRVQEISFLLVRSISKVVYSSFIFLSVGALKRDFYKYLTSGQYFAHGEFGEIQETSIGEDSIIYLIKK